MPQDISGDYTRVGIAGAGRVAQAFGKALQSIGVRVDSVASRDPQHAQSATAFLGGGAVPVSYRELASRASHVLIAISDHAIRTVAKEIARDPGRIRVALHTSGSYGPELLESLSETGVSCGSIHPMQTISDGTRGAEALRNIAYSVSGSPVAVAWAERIVASLHGQVLPISPDSRHLYHAAAVMASNYIAALIDAAQEFLEIAGIPQDAALSALAPLIRTSVENCIASGPLKALTGPIVRGDAATVAAHLAALQKADASARNLYKAAGLHALRMADQRGLKYAESASVRKALAGEQNTVNT